ncbi:MAG: hypothetical protein K1X82_06245 [Bacteroidia bacterium]|nr:hypothetical protein [Bacteroidia bacterium]
MSKKNGTNSASAASERWIALGVFLFLFIIGIAKQLNFPASDLGRHIKNGELVFDFPSLLSTNFYSYTLPDYPFVNHHWLGGYLFFLAQKFTGFTGLHVFYLGTMLAAMFLLMEDFLSKLNWKLSLGLCMVLMPFLIFRKEIRPEGFSYLFFMLWFVVMNKWKEKPKQLILFAFVLQLIWVNTHIFFFLAPMLTFFHLIKEWLGDKKQLRLYLIVLMVQAVACLINPNLLKGAWSPFAIFQEYGYMVSENQSVFFMQNRTGWMRYLHVEVLGLAYFAGLLWVIRKNQWKAILPELLLGLVGVAYGLLAIRGITLMGILCGIAMASVLSKWFESLLLAQKKSIGVFSLVLTVFLGLVGLGTKSYAFSYLDWNNGLGLIKGSNQAGEFFNKSGIKGPIFNNYDIGSYLIYHHFPRERVFTDNRPEAYSSDFFENTYNPCMKNEADWKKALKKYDFNCIYFYRHDNTEFGQPFLIRRIDDPEWIPVFVDDFNIILLRNTAANTGILNQFALDKSMFRSVPGN